MKASVNPASVFPARRSCGHGLSLLLTRLADGALWLLQRAKEQYLEAKPRLISDNGPQFIARDFKEFVRLSGMDHVRTSPY